jgi:hypothetical protein
MNEIKRAVYSVILPLLFSLSSFAQTEQSLAGNWQFKLDQSDKGIDEEWYKQPLDGIIALPGTTDEACQGVKTVGSDFGILTRAYKYYGPAWYQCEIEIPKDWKDKHLYLELERVMWESKLYIDDKPYTTQDALCAPHWHDIGMLSPGKHRLSLRINNDLIHNIGDKGHVYTEYTQSIWNGAVGRIRLVAKDRIALNSPQIFTDIDPCHLTLVDTLTNETGKNQIVRVALQLTDRQTGEIVFNDTQAYTLNQGATPLRYESTLPKGIKLWSDSSPNLYTLSVSLLSRRKTVDRQDIEFGFRTITASKSKLLVNGKPVFLRGNLDCVHFPLTGYPSCNVADWERIFRIYKDYGLNHVRFHSWCPPEAAFVAANRIGIYIQAETIWIDWWMTNTPPDRKDMITKGSPEGLGKNPSADKFVQQELKRMLSAYGNHPSFVMQCVGNELGNSDFDVMESWIKPLQAQDNRRLYSVSAARKVMPSDQYMVTHYLDKIGSTRGIKGGASTDWDFENVYSQSAIPVIAHEIGQWPVYPRWSEIDKYTGVLKARNFEAFRQQARKNKIESQNDDFVAASGALNQLMYKYEIESFLRTPSCAGIQLLSMQDYQGQGEALIGWLDVFYDSKKITTPETFRMHHDTTVVLLRIPKYIWSTHEPFNAQVQLAHYGTAPLTDGLYWKIKDSANRVLDSGNIPSATYAVGTSALVDRFSSSFKSITTPQQLIVEVGLNNHTQLNRWNIWVYPPVAPAPVKIQCVDRLDQSALETLASGGSVLLDASKLGTEATADPLSFYPLYWSLTFFPGQGKNTIGMLLQDKHPVFKSFPTQSHSDWQWQSIYKDAKAFYINDFPESYKPMAQPVDDFHRNNKLASIFELKVGKGKLLISGFDLSDSQNLAAQHLKQSMLNYMQTNAFAPSYSQPVSRLQQMFKYVEPLPSVAPVAFANASLYIACAANHEVVSASKPWNLASDRSTLKRNYSYQLHSDGTWKDESGTAWHGKEMELTIKCPQGIIGSLYVCFSDSNKQNRSGNIIFEGRSYRLNADKSPKQWVKLHIMREDSNDGMLKLKSNVLKGGNLMITEVVILEE